MRLLGLYAGIIAHGLILAVATPAHAGFDWGTACSSGDGTFQQYIGHFANVVIDAPPVIYSSDSLPPWRPNRAWTCGGIFFYLYLLWCIY